MSQLSFLYSFICYIYISHIQSSMGNIHISGVAGISKLVMKRSTWISPASPYWALNRISVKYSCHDFSLKVLNVVFI